MPPKKKKNELPEGETSGLMERLRQQRENVLANALYHLEGQSQTPAAPTAQPVLLPAPAFQVADIVVTLRELVQQGTGSIRLPVGSAGIVLAAALDFITVDFEGLGARMVPAHCLAVVEPTPRESPPDQMLDLVAALAAKVGTAR